MAHVMLDPLGIAFRGFLIDPKAQEERDHDPVSPSTRLGQGLALFSKEHRSIAFSPNEAGGPES